jgi:hypothetical protein
MEIVFKEIKAFGDLCKDNQCSDPEVIFVLKSYVIISQKIVLNLCVVYSH